MERNEERLILTSDPDYDKQYESVELSGDDKKAPKKENKDEKDKPWWVILLEYVRVIAIGALIAFLLCKFVIINAVVPTGSMIPTIQENDRLIGFRMIYYFEEPKRGDIVIFETPDPRASEGTLYIKRVIGLPGETVTISGSTVTITNEAGEGFVLNEPYLQTKNYADGYLSAAMNNQTITLDDDEYFMMGDNRDNSNDSRSWGPVKADKILAKAIFKYFKGFEILKSIDPTAN